MRKLIFVLIGILFGIIMTKGEVVSWFRMQEMFRFQSFHMYGVMGTAVVISAIGILIMKRAGVKTIDRQPLKLKSTPIEWVRLLGGGMLFGLGWAMTGACPGPLYILLGQGNLIVGVIIVAALLGAFAYGALRSRLPH